ncbi:hypothetical protein F5Y14DRAFT_401336 [Nemania sp. NC0429]|nr:hypothetical protein F5Y14DRAFT_401336 [Nemania sp. NC0429]
MKSIFLVLVAACLVVSQDNRPPDPNNHFIYPPLPGPQFSNDPSVFGSNLNFTVGSPQSQPFKWVSDMDSMQIILQQEGNQISVRSHELTECQSGSIDYIYWDGDLGGIDLKNGIQAFLSAYNCSNPGSTPVFFSHYINLTEPIISQSSSITSSTATSTADSTTSSAQPTTTNNPSTTPVATPTNTNDNSSKPSSDAAAIGGGVGGGVGGAIVVAAIVYAIVKTRKGHKQTAQPPNQAAPAPSWAQHEQNKSYYAASPQAAPYAPPLHTSELDSHHEGYNVASELPTETRQGGQ